MSVKLSPRELTLPDIYGFLDFRQYFEQLYEALKGQVPVGLVIPKDGFDGDEATLERELVERVREIRRGESGQSLLVLDGIDEPVEVSRRHLPAVRRALRGDDWRRW